MHGLAAAAIGFAVLYGVSNGVMTIVRGTVPAELFGRREFGALLGRLARPQLIARAIAPVALTLAFPFDPIANDHRVPAGRRQASSSLARLPVRHPRRRAGR